MVKSNKKQLNKVVRAVNGYKAPRPRAKITSMNDEGCVVTSNFLTPLLVVPAASQFDGVVLVNPPSHLSTVDAGGAVLRNYQEYKMRSSTLQYTPAVGTTTPGIVHLVYFDNPEIMRDWVTGNYNYAQKLALAKSSPMSVCGPVWMQMELAASMTMRRKRYIVNTETVGLSDEGYDLNVHGLYGIVTEGVPFSTNFGILNQHYTAVGYKLQLGAVSGI